MFDRKPLSGAQDQKPPPQVFELYHFEERRDPGDVSVDRLGKTGIDGKVRNYVEQRAIFAASSFTPTRQFLGWAVVSARELQTPAQGPRLSVIPSPIAADNELSENKYHAHIERPAHYQTYEMAVHLKTIFERNYHFQAANSQPQPAAETKSIRLKLWDWMLKNFARSL